MTCAKREVTCYIVTPDGRQFMGTNGCDEPQDICPRRPSEGYEKCRTICKQPGHAEEIALGAAGSDACGATAYLEGIGHYCKACQIMLFRAGVVALRMGRP